MRNAASTKPIVVDGRHRPNPWVSRPLMTRSTFSGGCSGQKTKIPIIKT